MLWDICESSLAIRSATKFALISYRHVCTRASFPWDGLLITFQILPRQQHVDKLHGMVQSQYLRRVGYVHQLRRS